MLYSIDFEPIALRQFKKLGKNIHTRLKPKIFALAENPRPSGVKKLQSYENTYRIRVGDYRVVYEIHDKILRILIIEVGHRSNVY